MNTDISSSLYPFGLVFWSFIKTVMAADTFVTASRCLDNLQHRFMEFRVGEIFWTI